ILSVKLKHLPHWNAARRRLAGLYNQALAPLPWVRPVRQAPENQSVYHLYVVRTADRSAVQNELTAAQIASGIHYPIPLHLQPCYRRLGLTAGSFRHAERACSEVLSLPIFPEMEEPQLRQVIQVLGNCGHPRALK